MAKTGLILLFIYSFTAIAFAQERGKATYYSSKLQGRFTSDGSRYHPDSMTCAHRTYPLGTFLAVKNPKNNKRVIVKVTDRGPFHKGLSIDLSYSAAKTLDIIRLGIATVEISQLDFLPQILNLLPIPKSYLQIPQFKSFQTLSTIPSTK